MNKIVPNIFSVQMRVHYEWENRQKLVFSSSFDPFISFDHTNEWSLYDIHTLNDLILSIKIISGRVNNCLKVDISCTGHKI